MKKKSFLLSLLITAVVVVYYAYKLESIMGTEVSEKSISFDVPRVISIKNNGVKDIDLSKYLYVWGEKNNHNSFNNRNNEIEKEKRFTYIYKEINGIQSVCLKSNISYRWEFYGTVFKGSSLEAIFFNPSLKKIVLLKQGDKLDKNLTVVGIFPKKVILKYKDEVFELKVFSYELKKPKKEKKNEKK